MRAESETHAIGSYLSDESNAFRAPAELVKAVFYPESERDVMEAMRTARDSGHSVTVSGAGTGITGGRVPMSGGMVMSMEKMRSAGARQGCREICVEGLGGEIRIRLDEERGMAHVAPGLSLAELRGALPRGMMYPPDPTEALASLGGTVATNASGARCFHYGPTRNWVEGLRVVLADGETLDIRRGECFADGNGVLSFASESGKNYRTRIPDYRMPDVKNAAGLYSKPGMDLIDLFIGSEGILGAMTEITIKLQPAGKEPVTDLAFFLSGDDALDYADCLRPMKGRGMLAIEYFDGNALDFIRGQHPEIPEKAAAAVLVEIEGEVVDALAELPNMLAANNASADWCANNAPDRRDMKEFRHSLPDSVNAYLKQHDSHKLGTDFAVPAEKFREMIRAYRKAGRSFEERFPRDGAHFVIFGHIGDYHVHFNFIASNGEERACARELYLDLARQAVRMGGTVSAEHGVGKKSVALGGRAVPYLELMYGEEGVREITRVKKALDPGWMLNRGNMVPTGC